MTGDQAAFAVVSAILASLGVGLTIRNWFYGGSVIRVELELAREEAWGGIISGTVARWLVGDDEQLQRLGGMNGAFIDIAKVTVRNLGRTAATVHDVGLRAGRPPVPRDSWTAMANPLLPLGETASVVRIEAHDVKVFYFHTVPILRSAQKHFGPGPLAFRAAVMTGVGRGRLSARWRNRRWNVWVVKGEGDRSIVDKPLSMREQARLWTELTKEIYRPDSSRVRQISDHAARLVDIGSSRDEILAELATINSIFGVSERPDREARFMEALTDHLVQIREDELRSSATKT